MKIPMPVLALLALSCSSACLATDCFVPVAAQPTISMNVVAPEMMQSVGRDPFCLGAAEAIARIRGIVPIQANGTAAYVPMTKDDNSPWRFDMSQNGKQMTSVEFDAWMKAKGIRVATGKPGSSAAAEPAAAPAELPAPVQTGN